MKDRRFIAIVLLIVCLCSLAACTLPHTVTTEFSSVQDYGVITGTGTRRGDNQAREAFFRLFPESIDPSFEDVHYHFKAVNNFTYAFEASLEFEITDPQVFEDYILSIAPKEQFTRFAYDSNYFEYLPRNNYLTLRKPSAEGALRGEGTEYDMISHAIIDRVLINPSDQRVLFFILEVEDATKATDLDDFFSRFNIDPKEFAERYPFTGSVLHTTD